MARGNGTLAHARTEAAGGSTAITEPPAPAKGGKTKAPKLNEVGQVRIEIPQIQIGIMTVKIVGDSPLVTHAWSEKARRMMLNKQMKIAAGPKEAKDPDKECEGAMYVIERNKEGKPIKWGLPASSFKSAAVDACSFIDGVTKVVARGAFHVLGELVEIVGPPPVRDERMVRIAMGTADIRFRPRWDSWSCELKVRYNRNVLSPSQIINLLNVAGFAIGVCEHRPQCNGSWGMFHVDAQEDK